MAAAVAENVAVCCRQLTGNVTVESNGRKSVALQTRYDQMPEIDDRCIGSSGAHSRGGGELEAGAHPHSTAHHTPFSTHACFSSLPNSDHSSVMSPPVAAAAHTAEAVESLKLEPICPCFPHSPPHPALHCMPFPIPPVVASSRLPVSAAAHTAEAVESLKLEPIAQISGTVNLPGSKSLSNRLLLLAALAKGETVVDNLLASDDVTYMLAALRSLGVPLVEMPEKRRVIVTGSAGVFPVGREAEGEGEGEGTEVVDLFLGNAGTAMRPLTAAVAVAGGNKSYVLDGVPRMRERPIGDLVAGLQQLGCACECSLGTNCPPVRVAAKGGLPGGTVKLSGAVSSQYLTALLMSLPLAKGDSCIEMIDKLVSVPYVEMTLRLMERFGVHVQTEGNWERFLIPGNQTYIERDGVCRSSPAILLLTLLPQRQLLPLLFFPSLTQPHQFLLLTSPHCPLPLLSSSPRRAFVHPAPAISSPSLSIPLHPSPLSSCLVCAFIPLPLHPAPRACFCGGRCLQRQLLSLSSFTVPLFPLVSIIPLFSASPSFPARPAVPLWRAMPPVPATPVPLLSLLVPPSFSLSSCLVVLLFPFLSASSSPGRAFVEGDSSSASFSSPPPLPPCPSLVFSLLMPRRASLPLPLCIQLPRTPFRGGRCLQRQLLLSPSSPSLSLPRFLSPHASSCFSSPSSLHPAPPDALSWRAMPPAPASPLPLLSLLVPPSFSLSSCLVVLLFPFLSSSSSPGRAFVEGDASSASYSCPPSLPPCPSLVFSLLMPRRASLPLPLCIQLPRTRFRGGRCLQRQLLLSPSSPSLSLPRFLSPHASSCFSSPSSLHPASPDALSWRAMPPVPATPLPLLSILVPPSFSLSSCLVVLLFPFLSASSSPGRAFVEGDASSASYFLAGAAITGGTVTVHGCGRSSLQVRSLDRDRG
ncbi:unnamed protein product [Closterium sp. NIES-54]